MRNPGFVVVVVELGRLTPKSYDPSTLQVGRSDISVEVSHSKL